MKTSSTEDGTLLVFADRSGAAGRWLRVGEGAVRSGLAEDGLPPARRTVLAVPGQEVTLHWIALAEGLAPAQAAAAARLMLADATAEPLAGMHVALGRPERGLTPVATVPARLMAQWLEAARASGIEPDAIVPSPLLIEAPAAGFRTRDLGGLADYRGPAAAFAIEPDLAGPLVAGAPVEALDDAGFEAGLEPLLAEPILDLRQGPFARRQRWPAEGRRARRIAALALALAVLTLAVQIATILAYTFAADRMRSEADAIAAQSAPGAAGPGFGAAAAVLFEAVRATPNVELAQLEYRRDGSLDAILLVDAPASLAALQQRIEASGLSVESGGSGQTNGRPTGRLTVRPA